MRHDLNTASLLRAGADGELTADEQARLEAHLEEHPEDASRLEFERQLRTATARVMAQVDVPEGLKARIEAAVEPPEVIAPRFGRRSRVAALAASVLLVAGVLVALIVPASPVGPTARYQTNLVSFLDREHVRCWVDTETILDKFDTREADTLPEAAQALFGRPLDVDRFGDLDGLTYVGGGACSVPGGAPSMHLGFRTDGARGEAGIAVSLFIQVDTGRLGLEEGVTYRLTRERRPDSRACTIFAWTHDGLLHFMVSDDAGACDLGRASLGAPDVVQRL